LGVEVEISVNDDPRQSWLIIILRAITVQIVPFSALDAARGWLPVAKGYLGHVARSQL